MRIRFLLAFVVLAISFALPTFAQQKGTVLGKAQCFRHQLIERCLRAPGLRSPVALTRTKYLYSRQMSGIGKAIRNETSSHFSKRDRCRDDPGSSFDSLT
jgi:hypothetical protein